MTDQETTGTELDTIVQEFAAVATQVTAYTGNAEVALFAAILPTLLTLTERACAAALDIPTTAELQTQYDATAEVKALGLAAAELKARLAAASEAAE